MSALIRETKNLLEELPSDRLRIAKVFLQWLAEEELTEKEKKIIAKSRAEIACGDYLDWREFADKKI